MASNIFGVRMKCLRSGGGGMALLSSLKTGHRVNQVEMVLTLSYLSMDQDCGMILMVVSMVENILFVNLAL